jgi:hypothetical protein
LEYIDDVEKQDLREVDDIPRLSAAVKEARKKAVLSERQDREEKTGHMMELMEAMVGKYPLDCLMHSCLFILQYNTIWVFALHSRGSKQWEDSDACGTSTRARC